MDNYDLSKIQQLSNINKSRYVLKIQQLLILIYYQLNQL